MQRENHYLNFKRLHKYIRLLAIPNTPSTPLFNLLPRMWNGSSFSLRHISKSYKALLKFSQ